MRIAIVCTYYPFPPSVGGVETIVRNVARELAKRGHEVHIVTSNLDVTTQKPVTSLGVEEREGVVVHKLKPSSFRVGYARILEGLNETIAKIKPDIVHAHNLHPHLFLLAKWKKNIGYKLVIELHYPKVTVSSLLQQALLPWAMLYLTKTQRYADAFIVHTNAEEMWLRGWGIDVKKIYRIFFPAIEERLLNYSPRQRISADLCFVGRVVREKGLHILVKALHKIVTARELRTLIVGPVEEKYYKELKALIFRLNLDKYVEFKGPMYDDDKYDVLASSRIFVLPSFKEYTPNVILESQALGVPVIATRVGAIPEMVINGETGLLVEPGNVDQLAESIKILLTNEKLRAEMSIKAREWAKKFTLNNIIIELEKVYMYIQ